MHNCINLRLPTHGGLYAWEFEKNNHQANVKVSGQTIFNNTFLMIKAAVDGVGVAYVPYDLIEHYIASGQLTSVLSEWCPCFPGYYLYYPSRRHLPPAFKIVVDALRWHKNIHPK
jgi:DNA-binding transcriptional LysR family regulator